MIKSLSGKDSVENVKKDVNEIETINIKLEHSVAKLLSENENLRKEREHLKLIFKDQFDSIKKTRVFAIAALENELRKLKGKNVVDYAISTPIATTIAPGMSCADVVAFACDLSLLWSQLLEIMTPRMRTRSAGRPIAELRGEGTGERVGRGGRGKRPKGGNDERVDELNGQGNDQGGANKNVEGVNGAQVGNQGNVGNPNGNVVNENVQDNVRN
ncbi:hypothetical protein Tco_0905213, partial [Tanacetum coccineum]